MAKVIFPSVDDGGVLAFEVSSPLLSIQSSNRNFSDSKILPQFINLSVLKLDGSSFDVNVAWNAKVGDVKSAIEELFNSSSSLESPEEFSWSQVWGYFCLCYNGEKLMNDKADIQTLGIKDMDQLQFVKHLAMDYTPNTPSRHQIQNPTRSSGHFLTCLSRPHTFEVEDGCQENYKRDGGYGNNEISIPKFRVGSMFSSRNTYLRLLAFRRKK